MIVTVTLNAALDKTAELDSLRPGELNRLCNVVTDIGGKGINVSKMVAALGGRSTATGFVGGGSGETIVNALAQMEIEADFVKVDGITRTNLKVLDKGMCLTEFNEPGIQVSQLEACYLVKKLIGYSNPETIFVLSGSLCQGVETEFYARLIRIIHQGGGLAYLDADGEAFRAALEEKPDFIKPNRHELLEFFHLEGEPSLVELRELCLQLMDGQIPRMALSMGEDGALFLEGSDTVYAPGLSVHAHSAVGAGDSMMGAFAYGADTKMSWRQAAALALASSAGAVTTVGTKPPDRALVEQLVEQVRLESIYA